MSFCRHKVALLGLLMGTIALGGVAPAHADGVTLRYKFKKGEKLPYAMTQKMDMAMNVGGNDIT